MSGMDKPLDDVGRIIDEAYPPGSEKRRHLDAAVEDAEKLLIEHGYGHLLEETPPAP